MDFYPWIVFLHVLGAFGFVMGHGASAFVSVQLREERDRDRIAALLNLSRQSLGMTYGSLLLLIVAGVIAGFAGEWWGADWLWAAIVLLVLMLVAMYGMATPYYRAVREAAGIRPIHAPDTAPAPDPSPQQLDALLTSSRPMQIMGIGSIGLLLIIWLMVVKPF
jgi:MFS family permease